MRIEMWPLARLAPYARNPRKNDHAVADAAAAIREFGFRVPVIARSDGTVIDGHLRIKAAQFLGLKEVPVIPADDMTEAQIKAFRISVNRVAEYAEWDDGLLVAEIAELKEMDYDFTLTGFDQAFLDSLEKIEKEEREKSESPGRISVPLVFELTTSEMKRWRTVKKRLKTKDDTEAFLKLMEAYA